MVAMKANKKPLHKFLAEKARDEARKEFHDDNSMHTGFFSQQVFDQKFSEAMLEEIFKIMKEQRRPPGLNSDVIESLEGEIRRAFCYYALMGKIQESK
jgi:hypothetical protein